MFLLAMNKEMREKERKVAPLGIAVLPVPTAAVMSCCFFFFNFEYLKMGNISRLQKVEVSSVACEKYGEAWPLYVSEKENEVVPLLLPSLSDRHTLQVLQFHTRPCLTVWHLLLLQRSCVYVCVCACERQSRQLEKKVLKDKKSIPLWKQTLTRRCTLLLEMRCRNSIER